MRLDRAKDVSLRDNVAWPGTDVFLSMAPGMKIFQGANEFGAARTPSKEEEMDPWKGINTPDRPR